MRGFVLGSLALIGLYVVVTNSENTGAVLGTTAALFERLVSPAVGGVPDLVARRGEAALPTPAPGGTIGVPSAATLRTA